MAIALFVSLALNLFLVGVMTTNWLRDDGPANQVRFGRFNREAAMAVISAESREKVESLWKQHMDAIRGHSKARRRLRVEMRALLQAASFDRAAYDALSKQSHARSQRSRLLLRQIIGETAEILSPAERKRYFETGLAKRKKKKRY